MTLTKDDLQAIKGIVEDSLKDLKDRTSSLETESVKLNKHVDSIESGVVYLTEHMTMVEADIKDLKSTKHICAIDPDLVKKVSVIDQIIDTVGEHSEQIKELQAKMA